MALNGVAAAVTVDEPSQVAEARRVGASLARSIGFDAERAGQLAVVVTESGTNLLRHAGGGQIVLRVVHGRGEAAVDVLALDRGPGMKDVARCLEDGYSTAGGAGTGLGAMRRLSTLFDLYSRQGRGTAILSRVGAAPSGGGLVTEGLSIPLRGEEQCGDAWVEETRVEGVTALVVDGLGHGPVAAQAAAAAVAAFNATRGEGLARRLEALHGAMRSTRGGAVGIADVDLDGRRVRFVGVGNVGAVVVGGERPRFLMSHDGTLGHTVRRIQEVSVAWPPRGVLVMYTDGLATPRELGAYPGLTERHPSLVAGVLWRDLARGRDDVTVVVAKEAA